MWAVRADVAFDTRWTAGTPSLRNVRMTGCYPTWSLFISVEVKRCEPNFTGWPTQSNIHGRPVTIYRPGMQFETCMGVKPLGAAVCATWRSVIVIVNYNDNNGGYEVWAPQTRML